MSDSKHSRVTVEQLEATVKDLRAQVQALAEDYAKQIYGHRGEVVWQPETGDGWLRVVPNRFEAAAAGDLS